MTNTPPTLAETLTVSSELARDRERNPYWTYLARLGTRSSRVSMQAHLDNIAMNILGPPGTGESRDDRGALVAWWSLGYERIARFRSDVIALGWSATYINGHLSALRGVLAEACRLGYLSPDQCAHLSDFRNVPRTGPMDQAANATEVDQMLAACTATPGPAGMRDAAIIAALAAAGGRFGVVFGLKIEDYDRDARTVAITSRGGRPAALPGSLAVHIDRWLDHLGEQQGPMFRPVAKSGRIRPAALSRNSIIHVIRERRQSAGLQVLGSRDWERIFSEDARDPAAG